MSYRRTPQPQPGPDPTPEPDRPRCLRPPPGWACARVAGHPGPCAAFEHTPRVLAPQPAPTGDGAPVWPIAIEWAREHGAPPELLALMAERDRQGRERYGTPLRVGNGRDALADALQESLDLVAYLTQRLEETNHGGEWAEAYELRKFAVNASERIRQQIGRRDAANQRRE